jgi:hypothetical protein
MELKGNMTKLREGEENLHFEKDVCEDWMETIASLKHFQHLQNICNDNNNRHMKVYRLLNYREREW